MRRAKEDKISSTIYERLNAAQMSEAERQTAINAIRNAELLADAVVWVIRKVEHLGSRLFLKASYKH